MSVDLKLSLPAAPRFLSGLHEVATDYDGFILDLWGVLHDGARPYPGAVPCLEALMAAGKRLAILSNAPRRVSEVVQRMTEIGIPRGLYHGVLSSGEEAWLHLREREDPFYAGLGRACLHIGPERDAGMLEGLDLIPAATAEAADFILNTGPWGWEETVADYEARLQAARRRDLPMICANPDLVVRHRGHLQICAGALATRYEELGGRVRWHGKPFPEIYSRCLAILGITDRRRILAVGDSLRTDIAGAAGFGIDSVLVAGGIHSEEFGIAAEAPPDLARIMAVLETGEARPDAVIERFLW
jgi:HAD superfamily hydrolase (TIGR01459 family)